MLTLMEQVMRGARFARWVVLVALVSSVLVAVLGSWRTPDLTAVSGYVQTSAGPLGPADRDALVRVKQAGLWEMPAGVEAAKRGHSPQLRAVARKIADEHHDLDRITDLAAAQVGVQLPAEATVEQPDWVAQIEAAGDQDVDRIAVNLLRQAHGKVLPLLAQVRAGTRNDVVRHFLDTSMTFVARHIGYLESTCLVDYSSLPAP